MSGDREAGALLGDIIRESMREAEVRIADDLKKQQKPVVINSFNDRHAKMLSDTLSESISSIDIKMPDPVDIAPLVKAVQEIKFDSPDYSGIVECLEGKNVDLDGVVSAIRGLISSITKAPDLRNDLQEIKGAIAKLEMAVKENTNAIRERRTVEYDNQGRVIGIRVGAK